LLLNFLVDFLLLMGTNRLCGYATSALRCAGAAVVGAVYSGACLLPGFAFLGKGLWPLVSLGTMAVLCFGFHPGTLGRGSVFVMLSMALGGLAMSVGRGNFWSLTLWALLLWILCSLTLVTLGTGETRVSVQLTYGQRTVELLALRDTGNTLRDPITGESVLVLSAEAACRLTGLSPGQLADPVSCVQNRLLPGLRLIPCQTVGGSGLLLALRPDKVIIGRKTGRQLVALSPEGFGGECGYQALTGGVV